MFKRLSLLVAPVLAVIATPAYARDDFSAVADVLGVIAWHADHDRYDRHHDRYRERDYYRERRYHDRYQERAYDPYRVCRTESYYDYGRDVNVVVELNCYGEVLNERVISYRRIRRR